MYGQCCDMNANRDIADEFSLKIIEDCAEAIGSSINNRSVGNFGCSNRSFLEIKLLQLVGEEWLQQNQKR